MTHGDLTGLIASIAALGLCHTSTLQRQAGFGSQSLSRALRPCDDIMGLIGESVVKCRERITRHYHLRQYFNYVQLSAKEGESKLPWRPVIHYKQHEERSLNHAALVNMIKWVARKKVRVLLRRTCQLLPSEIANWCCDCERRHPGRLAVVFVVPRPKIYEY